MLRRLERLRFSSLSGRGSVAQHDRIIALCGAGDVEGAVVATRANWQTLLPLLDTGLPDGEEPDGRPVSASSQTDHTP
jgi:DNA-binding GntR family transcriptional regulator